MAGRNHLTLPSSLNRSITERHIIHQHHHLEDRITIQHREIRSLLLDNQRLAAAHVALKRDLALAQQEHRHLSAASANVKSERDAEVREVYEKSLKMDAEARAIDAMTSDLARVRADVNKFMEDNRELKAELEAVNYELAKARMEAKQVPVLVEDMETVRKEIHKGRNAIEFENKARANPTYNGNYGNFDGGSYSMPQAGVACRQFVPIAGTNTMPPVSIEGQGSHTPNVNGFPSTSGAISVAPLENQIVKL
ncbi:hypothetical protein V6N13_119515 [Hibiscus sabdariffa]|uniref:Protein FLC EXPRESSOR n=1 Tax=Hibiscus sabdariffa TaxID=183260 RepID=A0ABR2E367_9ROSI